MSARTFDYRGRLRLLILDALSRGYTHGYSIMKYLTGLIGYSPGPGSIYPHLRYLSSKGYVEVISELRNGRILKEYKLTPKGISYLSERKSELRETLTMIEGFRALMDLGWRDVVLYVRNLIVNLPSMNNDEKLRVRQLIRNFLLGLKEIQGLEVRNNE